MSGSSSILPIACSRMSATTDAAAAKGRTEDRHEFVNELAAALEKLVAEIDPITPRHLSLQAALAQARWVLHRYRIGGRP